MKLYMYITTEDLKEKSYIVVKFKEPNTLQPKSTGRTKYIMTQVVQWRS